MFRNDLHWAACLAQYLGTLMSMDENSTAGQIVLYLLCLCGTGDEGGFAPNIASNDEGLDLVNQAIAVRPCHLPPPVTTANVHVYEM